MNLTFASVGQDGGRFAWNDLNVPGSSLRATARRRARFGVLATALALAASGSFGCGGSSDAGAAPSTTSKPTTTTAPTQSEAEAAVAGFKEAVFAVLRAAMIPDPNDPAVERTNTGPMLDQAREVLRGYQLRKIRLQYPEPLESGFEITVDSDAVELTADTAVFEACTVDRGQRVSSDTGEVIAPNDDPEPVRVRVGMRLVDGTWKLAERRNLDTPAGTEGCVA
jgi:hypothetical protein